VFSIVKSISILEDSCFLQQPASWSSYHSNSYHSSPEVHVIPQLMLPYEQKVKSFKQRVFLLEQCAVSKVTTSVLSAVFRPW